MRLDLQADRRSFPCSEMESLAWMFQPLIGSQFFGTGPCKYGCGIHQESCWENPGCAIGDVGVVAGEKGMACGFKDLYFKL